jgi:hypothetical protein
MMEFWNIEVLGFEPINPNFHYSNFPLGAAHED